ncbi:MAG: hypothetical protein V1794_11470 [Candidatus Glassbacteria bacterium]
MLRLSSYRNRINLLAASFGAAALVVQTELLRAVMAAAAGGTLAVGAALGAWLAWIAVGAALGGVASSRTGARAALVAAASWLALPAGIAGVLYLSAVRQLVGVPAGQLVPLTDLFSHCALACLPFPFLAGFSFPLLSALAGRDDIAAGEPTGFFIGGIWAAEAAGAFVAGVVYTFLLAGRISQAAAVAVAASLPAVAALFVLEGRLSVVFRSFFIASVIAIGLLIPAIGGWQSRLYWQGLGAPGRLLAFDWTRYRCLIVGELSGQFTLYDNGSPSANFPDEYNSATEVSLLLSQHPSPESVLVVGSCAGGAAQALLAAGVSWVTAVHPDAEFERRFTEYLPSQLEAGLHSNAYRYICADGRSWLGRPRPAPEAPGHGPAGWDVIWLNLDGPAQMNASRYYTPGFFRLARRALGPAGGLLALRLPTAATTMLPAQRDQAAAVWNSLTSSFRHVALAVGSNSLYLFAAQTDSVVTENLGLLLKRLTRYEGRVPLLERYLVYPFYDQERIGKTRTILEERSLEVPPHTDSTPEAWFQNIRLWAHLTGVSQRETGRAGLVERLLDYCGKLNSRSVSFLPALIVTVVLCLLWVSPFGRSPSTLLVRAAELTVLTAGIASMGAVVSLIYVCQIVFGGIFYQVAMISAAYMAAMAAGSWWASKKIPAAAALPGAVSLLAFLIALAVTVPALMVGLAEPLYDNWGTLGNWLAQLVFYAGVALVGLFCGVLFPWAAALHNRRVTADGIGRTAAALDCADHLGAMTGAIIPGVFAVPAFGIGPVCSGLGLMMVCISLFWLSAGRASVQVE